MKKPEKRKERLSYLKKEFQKKWTFNYLHTVQYKQQLAHFNLPTSSLHFHQITLSFFLSVCLSVFLYICKVFWFISLHIF
jgi:hypothetical protein